MKKTDKDTMGKFYEYWIKQWFSGIINFKDAKERLISAKKNSLDYFENIGECKGDKRNFLLQMLIYSCSPLFFRYQ